MALTCCQLLKHGKYVAAHPWFEPGAIISLGNAKQYMGDIGSLALVQAGARNVGRVVEVLGSVESIHAVMRGLLAEEGLLGPDPAPGFEVGEPAADIASQLDELPTEIPFLDQREDRRADLVVTIDPPTAKDHDDAIGLEAADDDDHAWKLWVHIADVAAYVPVGSPIDLEAADRAMSAYVPGTVAPMLPHALSSDLCSLRPGVDRGCVSVCADIAEDGAVVRARFARTLIRSARRLSYDQVDRLIQDGVAIDPVIDELLRGLDGVTRLLRNQRMQRGALDMALPDVEIELGDEHPEDAILASESRSHQLVEECMLVANDAVGLRLAQAQAPGIWRVHDHPDPQAVVAMLKAFEQLGVPTPPVPDDIAGVEAAKLAAEAAKRAGRYAETARRGRVTFVPRVLRALKQAEYRAKTGPHSGLATMHYAHFTSPIRRYPDLVNHRSLLQLLGLYEEAAAAEDLPALAEHVSGVERELQKLERRADKITLAYLLYRRLHGGDDGGDDGQGRWRGEINGLIGAGMFVRFGGVFEGFLPARVLSPDERYQLDELGLAMVGVRSGHRFRLGDAVDVYVDRVDRATGKVDLRRAPPDRDQRRTEGHRAPLRNAGTRGRNKGKGTGAGGGAGRKRR